MSQENIELMRRTFERWNAGEREVDPEIADPEMVVYSAMTDSAYHGYEGLRRWMAEIDDQFDDWSLSIDEFRGASEGRLLALGTVHVRGRTSGVAFDQPMALLLAFAEGRLIELRTIPDHAQAREAAGLEE
jgi:ketosteroid isomerase-like protein